MNAKVNGNGFDPVSRLSILEDGSQYLGARERLLWFLGEQDEYSISSSLERVSSALAIVKVSVATRNGRKVEALGSAALGSDYRAVETAETHALARALALLGYGTEAALEIDTRTIADSPSKPQDIETKNGNGSVRCNDCNLSSWATSATSQSDNKPAEADIHNMQAEPVQEVKVPDGAISTDAQPELRCSDCEGLIKEGKLRDGTLVTADEVAERARKRFDRPLCARCLTRQMVQTSSKEVTAG